MPYLLYTLHCSNNLPIISIVNKKIRKIQGAWIVEQANWKNLRRNIEARDFRSRSTFVSTGKNILSSWNVSSQSELQTLRATCRNSYSESRERNGRTRGRFHSPRFSSTRREIEIQFQRDELSFRNGIVLKYKIQDTNLTLFFNSLLQLATTVIHERNML